MKAAVLLMLATCSGCAVVIDYRHGLIAGQFLDAVAFKGASFSWANGDRARLSGVASDVSAQASGIVSGITAGVVRGLGL